MGGSAGEGMDRWVCKARSVARVDVACSWRDARRSPSCAPFLSMSLLGPCPPRGPFAIWSLTLILGPPDLPGSQACPRGSRTDGYVCVPCGPVPVVSYDVMFFTFWIVAVSASHALALYATPRTPWRAAYVQTRRVVRRPLPAVLTGHWGGRGIGRGCTQQSRSRSRWPPCWQCCPWIPSVRRRGSPALGAPI